ncbi:MAG: FMN-binding protein, partial [Bacteroidales bacterium]|nr:FMN-binding protein [Bacteroidales bacterium]
MVGITPDGVVYNTSVLSHTETPGLGAKCGTDEHFYSQFKGFNPAERILSVKKDGGDVDAITASTITSRAYALAVKNAVDAFNTIKGE